MKKLLFVLILVFATSFVLTACVCNCTCDCSEATNEGSVGTYTATITMYANSSKNDVTAGSITSADLDASVALINTIETILYSEPTLELVVKYVGCSLSTSEILNMLSIESVNDTAVFRVSVTGKDAELMTDIANTIGIILPERVAEIIDGASVKIVSNAKIPAK